MEPLKYTRRGALKLAALGGAGWMTAAAEVLAQRAPQTSARTADSLILLWLAGGPSQLETFDPHPGRSIGGGTRAIGTSLAGVQFAQGLERVAEHMDTMALVRNVVGKEGDHERGTYLMKTGYRPDPTVVHPSIGAICCHQMPLAATEIPRHVSIMPGRWRASGGLLGRQYDAFNASDPQQRLTDARPVVPPDRFVRRIADVGMIDQAFARGRRELVNATLHGQLRDQARAMMTSDQLRAFQVDDEPAAVLAAYGDTPFGRGCLAARRLIEVGVRCVEVTLRGWDTHANNHQRHGELLAVLDPAMSALLSDLKRRGLFDRTVLVCAGEFGRTPRINGLEGRDHWPHGFSVLMSGGRLARGRLLGQTDPEGGRLSAEEGTTVADLHATILTALGIDPHYQVVAAVGRPIKFSEGTPVAALVEA